MNLPDNEALPLVSFPIAKLCCPSRAPEQCEMPQRTPQSPSLHAIPCQAASSKQSKKAIDRPNNFGPTPYTRRLKMLSGFMGHLNCPSSCSRSEQERRCQADALYVASDAGSIPQAALEPRLIFSALALPQPSNLCPGESTGSAAAKQRLKQQCRAHLPTNFLAAPMTASLVMP
jgi:hypothetical protein